MTVITFISCRLTAAHIILVNSSVSLLDFCDAAAFIFSTVFYLRVSLSFDGPTTPLLRVCIAIDRMDGPITSRRGSLSTTWRRAVPLPLTGRTDGLTQGYHTIYTALHSVAR